MKYTKSLFKKSLFEFVKYRKPNSPWVKRDAYFY